VAKAATLTGVSVETERASVGIVVSAVEMVSTLLAVYRRYGIVDEARMREEAEKLQAWAEAEAAQAEGSRSGASVQNDGWIAAIMTSRVRQIGSGHLTADQIHAELEAMPTILLHHGIEHVVAFFGIGTDVDDEEELLGLRPLAVADLLDFTRTSIERGLFIPAKSDMVFQLEDESTVLKFCHESDIHLDSDNRKLIDEMIARWKRQGIPGYEKVGDE